MLSTLILFLYKVDFANAAYCTYKIVASKYLGPTKNHTACSNAGICGSLGQGNCYGEWRDNKADLSRFINSQNLVTITICGKGQYIGSCKNGSTNVSNPHNLKSCNEEGPFTCSSCPSYNTINGTISYGDTAFATSRVKFAQNYESAMFYFCSNTGVYDQALNGYYMLAIQLRDCIASQPANFNSISNCFIPQNNTVVDNKGQYIYTRSCNY